MRSTKGENKYIMLLIVIIKMYIMLYLKLMNRFDIEADEPVFICVKNSVISSFIISLSKLEVNRRNIIPEISPSISSAALIIIILLSINFFILKYIKVFDFYEKNLYNCI